MVGRQIPAIIALPVLVFVTLFSITFSTTVYAAAQIADVEDSAIPTGLNDDQIVKTIQRGGTVRGWVVKKIKAGHLQATIFVRSHMAKVDINYTANSYSIRYNDSENLGFKNGKIHRNYNKWVRNLNMDIQREFAML